MTGWLEKGTYNLSKVLEELDSLRFVHKVRHFDAYFRHLLVLAMVQVRVGETRIFFPRIRLD